MPAPHIAARAPLPVDVTKGTDYWWCSCGLSKNQPFCDGSHKVDNAFAPMKYTAEEDKRVFFCTCKHTAKSPLCDGTHKTV